MVIENKVYKFDLVGTEWKCFEVPQAFADGEFANYRKSGRNINFTIRRFQSGAMFMLYSTCAAWWVVKRQADYMSSTPGH